MDRKTLQAVLNIGIPPMAPARFADRLVDTFMLGLSPVTATAAVMAFSPQAPLMLGGQAWCAGVSIAFWFGLRLKQNRTAEAWLKAQSTEFLANISQITSQGERLTVGFFRPGRLKQIVDHELFAHNQRATNRAAFWKALGITPSTPQP